MNSLLLLLFILFSLIIIFINNLYLLLSLLSIIIIFILIKKVKIKSFNKTFLFILFIFLMNALLIDIKSSLIISLRLIIMYLLINLLINKIGIISLAKTCGDLFHSKDLYLIVSISLTFIPIFREEIIEIKKAFIAKNFNWNLKNIILNSKLLITILFRNLFLKVDELNKSILAKGYY